MTYYVLMLNGEVIYQKTIAMEIKCLCLHAFQRDFCYKFVCTPIGRAMTYLQNKCYSDCIGQTVIPCDVWYRSLFYASIFNLLVRAVRRSRWRNNKATGRYLLVCRFFEMLLNAQYLSNQNNIWHVKRQHNDVFSHINCIPETLILIPV